MKIKFLKLFLIILAWLLFCHAAPMAHASTIAKPPNFLKLTSGLVGWWTFDGKDTPWTSATAATTLDKSGNGKTGTLTNMAQATSPTAGKIGQGFKFDGVDDYVALPATGSYLVKGSMGYASSEDFTLSVWYKGTDLAENSAWGKGLISWNSGGLYAGFVLRSGYAEYIHYASGAWQNNIKSTTLVANGKWHHLMYVNTNNLGYLYIDGVREVDGLSSTIDSGGSYFQPYHIGSNYNNQFTSGSLDDVRIYNRAMSAGEITQLYNLGSAKFNVTPALPLTSGLVGHWTFDGKDMINNVADKSGQNNNGYWLGGATTTVPGKIGQGLIFDGVNDYVNVTDASPLNPTNVTMSAWVKTSTTGGYIVAKDPSTAGPLGPGTMASSSASGGTAKWNFSASIDTIKVEDGVSAAAVVGVVKCVAPDSIISTSEGDKQIKDLKIGDFVYSYNTALEKIELKKVLSVVNGPLTLDNNEWYHVYFTDGDIKATFDHPFYVNGQFIEAKDLKVGDELFDMNGRKEVVQNIIVEKNYTDYSWGIAVEDNHNFFANGILVHNVPIALDKYVQIIKGGNIGSTNKADATAWSSTNGYTPPAVGYYGGTSDLWGETWTAEDINASNFGVAIAAQGSGGMANYISYYLLATNFGFNIPTGSTINGIKVEIKKGGSGTCTGICARVDYLQISVDYTSGKTNVPYALSTVNGGEFLIKNGATTYTVDSSTSVADNKWHQLASTYDGTTMRIYVDGVQKGLGTSFSGNLPTQAGNVRVGADYQATPANFFTGNMDDVRIYNRALSASEITRLYNLGAATKVDASPRVGPTACTSGLSCGLVGYWTFDGKDTPWTSATAATTLDKAGNGNTGTLTNMAQATSPTPGKIGQALKFDGVNDYVKTSTSVGLNTNAGGYNTASFWMKWNGVANSVPFSLPATAYYDFDLFSSTCAGFNTGAGDIYGFSPSAYSLVGKWAYVTLLFYNGGYTDYNKIYINGVQVALTQCLGSAKTGTAVSGNVYIGGMGNNSGVFSVWRYGGFIDDVRIYNRALSTTTIQQLYNLGR